MLRLFMLLFLGPSRADDWPPSDLRQQLQIDTGHAFSAPLNVDVDGNCVSYRGCDLSRTLPATYLEIVNEGLARLSIWNRPLVEKIKQDIRDKKLTLDCASAKAMGKYEEDTYFGVWTQRRMRLPVLAASLFLENRCGSSAEARNVQFIESYTKQNTFHEFLHFAQLDNLSADAHNHLDGEYLSGRQVDRVMSCAALAFPSATNPMAIANDGSPLDNTFQSCLTCAGERSQQACRRFSIGPEPRLPP